MARNKPGATSPAIRLSAAGLLSWLVPGLGHMFIGEKRRGWVILVTIAITFWGGVALGGVRSTVDPEKKKLWFIAQVSSGGHALVAYWMGHRSRIGEPEAELASSNWTGMEVATVYTGVAGLLSLLVLLDAMVRADRSGLQSEEPRGADAPKSDT